MTHHPECEDATGEYPGSCTCAIIKRREAMDDLIAQDADLIDLVGRLRRTYRKEFAATGSTVGDISNRLRPFPILATEVLFNPDGLAAADHIEALQADNAKLHNRLRNIRALATRQLYERGPNGTLADIEQFATVALQETER